MNYEDKWWRILDGAFAIGVIVILFLATWCAIEKVIGWTGG